MKTKSFEMAAVCPPEADEGERGNFDRRRLIGWGAGYAGSMTTLHQRRNAWASAAPVFRDVIRLPICHLCPSPKLSQVRNGGFFSRPCSHDADLAVLLNHFNLVSAPERGNSVSCHAVNMAARPETAQRVQMIYVFVP